MKYLLQKKAILTISSICLFCCSLAFANESPKTVSIDDYSIFDAHPILNDFADEPVSIYPENNGQSHSSSTSKNYIIGEPNTSFSVSSSISHSIGYSNGIGVSHGFAHGVSHGVSSDVSHSVASGVSVSNGFSCSFTDSNSGDNVGHSEGENIIGTNSSNSLND